KERINELRVQGESLRLTANERIKLTLGNAPGVRVEVNGKPYELGESDEKVREIELTLDSLNAGAPEADGEGVAAADDAVAARAARGRAGRGPPRRLPPPPEASDRERPDAGTAALGSRLADRSGPRRQEPPAPAPRRRRPDPGRALGAAASPGLARLLRGSRD